MNREDPQNQYRGHFRGQFSNKRHYTNRDPQWFDGSWIANQARKSFLPRSGRHKATPNLNWNKQRRTYVQSQEPPPPKIVVRRPRPVPPPRKSASPPPKSASPFPGTEEYFQKNIQLKSGSLLKQMEESPDSELVLPRNSQPTEDKNENTPPGMRFVQEAAESNTVELNSGRRKEKRDAQIAKDPEVMEIVQRIRQLRRQERVKVRRELEEVYNKTLNLQDCKTINTIMPDLTIKMEDMPQEFMSIFSDACTIDLDALAGGAAEMNSSFGVADNPIADGSMPYSPFDIDFDNVDDGSVREPRRMPPQCNAQPYFMDTFGDRQRDSQNHTHDDSLYDDGMDADAPLPEYTRKVSLKCNIKAGRPESRGKTKLKLRREAIDLTADDSMCSFLSLPPPPPPPTLESSHIYPHVAPPPPRISMPNNVPHDDMSFRQETWNIGVIADAKEAYNSCDSEERSDISNLRGGHSEEVVRHKPDVNANGYHSQFHDEIEFCADFDLGDEQDDEWNRKIIVKSKERVDRELTEEYMADTNEDEKICEARLRSDVTSRETSFQNGQLQFNRDSVKNTTRHVIEEAEELNYEPASDEDDEEEESQPVESCEVFQGTETEDTSQDASEIDNASVSDEVVGEIEEDDSSKAQKAPAILVLDPTSTPGRLVLNRGKLVNVQMICQKPASVDDVAVKENDKVTLSKPEATQTEESIITNKYSRRLSDDECDPKTLPIERPAKKAKLSITEVDPPTKEPGISTQDQAVQTSATRPSRQAVRDDVKRTNRRTQTDTDRTTFGKLRDKYNRYKRKTREALKKLHVIDKRLDDLLAERRHVWRTLEGLASTSESEDEPTQADNQKHDKKKAAKYIYISVDGSTPSKRNPILSSDSPSEQMLTQVLPKESENNPDSPSDLGQTLENMDLFSLIPENKASFNETAVSTDLEIRDETFTETSDTMPEMEATECENADELGGMMSIADTVPADILESSDNEYLGDTPLKCHNPFVKLIKYNVDDLHRLRNDVGNKSNDDQLPQSNNNVKVEDGDTASMESTANSLEDEVYDCDEVSDEIIDYVGWKDTILVITIIKNLIVAGNEKGKIFYYDTQSNYPIFSEALSTLAITSIVPQEVRRETRLYIGSLDGQLFTYDVEARREANKITVDAPIQCMEMSWSKLYVGTARGDILKCSLPKTKVVLTVNIMQGSSVLAIRCGMEGSRRIVVVAMRRGSIFIRDANTFLQLRTLGNVSCATVYSLELHNNRVYCGTSQDDVLAFNFHDGQLMNKFSESKGSGIVCMTTVKNLLFVACYNRNIYVYNTTDNSLITSILAPAGMLLSMAVVNKRLIAGTKQNFQCLPLPASIAKLL